MLGDKKRFYTIISDWNNLGYIDGSYKTVLPMKHVGFTKNTLTTNEDVPIHELTKFFTEKQ